MKPVQFAFASLAVAALLTGCAQRPLRPPMSQAQIEYARANAANPVPPMSEAEARKRFVGVTYVTHMPGHGTQVSYLDPNGTGRLWYPGNSVVLANDWKIFMPKQPSPGFLPKPLPQSMLNSAKVCFRYPEGSHNPHAYQPAGLFACASAGRLAADTVDQAPGDVFGLMTRREVPFVLSKDRATIAELKGKIAGAGR